MGNTLPCEGGSVSFIGRGSSLLQAPAARATSSPITNAMRMTVPVSDSLGECEPTHGVGTRK